MSPCASCCSSTSTTFGKFSILKTIGLYACKAWGICLKMASTEITKSCKDSRRTFTLPWTFCFLAAARASAELSNTRFTTRKISRSLDSLEVLHHLWLNCRGVHFLLTTTTTYRPDFVRQVHQQQQQQSYSGLPSQHSSTNMFRRSFEAQLAESSEMFSSFIDEGRFFQLTLEPLSKEASVELTKDLVKGHEDGTIDSIVASSGGNPLYIVQLTKSLVEEGADASHIHEARHSVANISAMCRRVEEIICYRLDQLDALSQAVLKAASVASSHGRSFTANVLAFALKKTVKQLQPQLFSGATRNASVGGGNLADMSPHPLGTSVLQPSLSQGSLHQANTQVNIDPRVRDVVIQCMVTLAERGEFIHPVLSIQVPSRSTDEQEMDEAMLTVDDVRFDTAFEFRIPTEQSTIYSLIIDEQREYFHGKMAQYYYKQRYENLGADLTSETSSSRHISRANSRVVRSSSHHSLRSQSSKRLSQSGNPLTLQLLLSCEQEIAFHAEQASLWSLAMRAYLHVGILSRRLGHHRQFVGSLLEAFKIIKLFEHDSGETITPLSLAYLQADKSEKGPNTVAGIISRMFLTGEVNDSDGAIISQELSAELDCVYNVFGSDSSTIILAAKLNLYLADFYMLAFGEVHLVPEILGIVLKLSLAARVCITEGQSTKSTTSVMLESAGVSGAFDEDQLVFFDSDHSTSVNHIEDSDLVHFVCTHFSLIRADPTSEYALHNTWKEAEMFETLFEDAEGGVNYDAQLILESVFRGDLATAKRRWQTSRIWYNEGQMLLDILRFGQDIHLYASSVLLQQLVYANDLDLVDSILARIDHHLELHGFSLLVFIAILPSINALIFLQKWEVIARWMERMHLAIDETHEIMAAEISLVRAMRQWINNWWRIAQIDVPPPQLTRIIPNISFQVQAAPGDVGEPIQESPNEEELAENDKDTVKARSISTSAEDKRRVSTQKEDEETQMLLRVMSSMELRGHEQDPRPFYSSDTHAVARRRSSMANLSTFLANEDLFVTAMFFLRPDRPVLAPEMLPHNHLSALEQWANALPPTIAKFVSHCGLAVESLGLQLLAMWLIQRPVAMIGTTSISFAVSAGELTRGEDDSRKKEVESAFRVAAGHIVHFATTFVSRITSTSSSSSSSSSASTDAPHHSVVVDAAMLANLVFTIMMLEPMRLQCPLIDDVLLGDNVPFRHTLLQLLHYLEQQQQQSSSSHTNHSSLAAAQHPSLHHLQPQLASIYPLLVTKLREFVSPSSTSTQAPVSITPPLDHNHHVKQSSDNSSHPAAISHLPHH